jgi:hypothetical protein
MKPVQSLNINRIVSDSFRQVYQPKKLDESQKWNSDDLKKLTN